MTQSRVNPFTLVPKKTNFELIAPKPLIDLNVLISLTLNTELSLKQKRK